MLYFLLLQLLVDNRKFFLYWLFYSLEVEHVIYIHHCFVEFTQVRYIYLKINNDTNIDKFFITGFTQYCYMNKQ